MRSPHLSVTIRCLQEDLNLSDVYAGRDARDYADRHEVVRVFVNKREYGPDQGEVIKSLRPRGAYRSLHLGRPRAATMWDPELDTCWLVAYGEFHADGDADDVYNYFADLQTDGRLAPTADDYEKLLEVTPEDLIASLRRMSPEFIDKARAIPGQEVRQDFVASHDATGTATITIEPFPVAAAGPVGEDTPTVAR